MDLLADFLHFGTSVFLLDVRLEQCEVWGVKSAVWSVKCEGSSGKWEVWSVECEVSVWSAKSAVWSVKCEVWGLECEGSSEKCEVWTVKCEVWSVKFEVWSAKSAVWSVECEDFASSLAEKKPLVEGRTRSGQVFLRTIGHLFLGNFRRRLARVYVSILDTLYIIKCTSNIYIFIPR